MAVTKAEVNDSAFLVYTFTADADGDVVTWGVEPFGPIEPSGVAWQVITSAGATVSNAVALLPAPAATDYSTHVNVPSVGAGASAGDVEMAPFSYLRHTFAGGGGRVIVRTPKGMPLRTL